MWSIELNFLEWQLTAVLATNVLMLELVNVCKYNEVKMSIWQFYFEIGICEILKNEQCQLEPGGGG